MEFIVSKLAHLFLYESKMRSIFEIFAEKANEEGYLLTSNVFKEISNLKRQYFRWIFNLFKDVNEISILNTKAIVDYEIFNKIGTTSENLAIAIKQLEYEWHELYFRINEELKEKNFDQLSLKLDAILEIKKKNFYRLKTIFNLLEQDILTNGKDLIVWICKGCNFEVAIDNLPKDYKCPSCGHLKSYFEKQNLSLLYLDNSEINIWKCIECGEEVILNILPNNWKCPKCERTREYFQKKTKDIYSNFLIDFNKEKIVWECMECGEEVMSDILPNNWKCTKCGRSRNYFKRKSIIHKRIDLKKKEKAQWVCEKCGHYVEISLSDNWKCPLCDK
ncbi:MAG: hypothetical protein KGD63_07745 [Candidatus Lokiarchaeota archaeon]|nr:hypothetical protein [Candidatus Lokiarchaeota archaeon]